MAHILITGCSGGGKSTLRAELARRGFATVAEPGRRIAEQQMALGGTGVPWIDMSVFLDGCVALAQADLVSAPGDRPVFFDRGLIDALAARERMGGTATMHALGVERPYAPEVLLAPPWPEIFTADPARRHGFDEALKEYEHLAELLPMLGYTVVTLPCVGVSQRADFVLARQIG